MCFNDFYIKVFEGFLTLFGVLLMLFSGLFDVVCCFLCRLVFF